MNNFFISAPEMKASVLHIRRQNKTVTAREQALIEAYEAVASLPLYQRLVDPFTSLEALWEFENLFVLSGQTEGSWNGLWNTFENLKAGEADEASARAALEMARECVGYCDRFSA